MNYDMYGFGDESVKDAFSAFGSKMKSIINSKTSGSLVYKAALKKSYDLMHASYKKLKDLPQEYRDDFTIKHTFSTRKGSDTINNRAKNIVPEGIAEAVKRSWNYEKNRFEYDYLYNRVEKPFLNSPAANRTTTLNGDPIWKLPDMVFMYPKQMNYDQALFLTKIFSKSNKNAENRAATNVDIARNMLKRELSRDIYDKKTKDLMQKYYDDINDWMMRFIKDCTYIALMARSIAKQIDAEIKRLTSGSKQLAVESFEFDIDKIICGNFDGIESEFLDFFESFNIEYTEGGLENNMEFYDEILNNATETELNEFTNGTESGRIVNGIATMLREMIRDASVSIKQAKYFFTGRELQAEDVEFMTKGAQKIRDEWYEMFKKHVEDHGLDKLLKPVKPTDSIKNAYSLFKQYQGKPIPAKLFRVTIASIEVSNETTDYPRLKTLKEAFKGKLVAYSSKEREILERIPHGFALDVTQEKLPNGSYMNHMEVYSCKFKSNKLANASGTESYSLNYVENVLSDDFLLGYDNPAMLFGMESINSRFSDYGFNDILDIINTEGGVESFVPVDMDFTSYVDLIEGTEGIGNFFARHWAKFRRAMHPLVKSDLKVTKMEYDKIKSTFETTVVRSMPALKNMLQQNRFIKYLMDNGALEINDKASKSFDNNSRMVASILIKFKSSKIKYDEKTGMMTIGGKKIDIMDLQDDEKFSILQPSNATGIIYSGINDIIKAINKTVYKQIKGEHILDKMGFNVKFLNDGTQYTYKQDGAVTYMNSDGYSGSASTYTIDEVNGITSQINNKDILIGMVSRPLVIKDAGVESFFDCSFDEILEGGTEMANNTETIIERMKLVEDTKKQVMQTPEYQRFAAGIEARESIERTAGENTDMKELLGKVYDKYGMAGLKDILK